MPYELKKLIDRVTESIDILGGFTQEDRHLKRNVKTIVDFNLLIDEGNIIRWLKKESPNKKYQDDWERMKSSFDWCVKKALEDIDSRQLMIFNDKNYITEKQCFTHMQMLNNRHDEIEMIVSQRSGDISKLKDDLIFFGSVAHKWEAKTKTKIRVISIHYGSLHKEV